MSLQAMTWALEVQVGSPGRKLVLWGLANHAHKDGRNAYCGNETLSEYAECDGRTVRRHLAGLIESGFIREGDQSAVTKYPPNRRPIVYDLAMTEAVVRAWAADHASGKSESPTRAKSIAAGRKGAAAKKTHVDRMSPQESPPENVEAPLWEDDRGDIWGDIGGDTDVSQTVGTSLSEREPGEPTTDVADATSPRELSHQLAVDEARRIVTWYMDAWKVTRNVAVISESSRAYNTLVGAGRTAGSAQYVTAALLSGLPGWMVEQALAEHGKSGQGVIPGKGRWQELLVKVQGGMSNNADGRRSTDENFEDWQRRKVEWFGPEGDGPAAIGGAQ